MNNKLADESFDRTASHMAGEYVAYKELTDEEIIAEAEKQDWLGLKSDSEWQPEIDFARAILKKVSEK
jgi:hypothetical protein